MPNSPPPSLRLEHSITFSNDLTFLQYVQKFIAAAKKHRESLGWERTICPSNWCHNKLVQEDSVVQSHLIRYGFLKDYTVWKFHGEGDTSDTGASERNSLTTTSSVNERGQQPSSSTATEGGEIVNPKYVSIDQLL